MAEQHIRIGNWTGGMSDDEKFALYPGSGSLLKAMDHRRNLSVLQLQRKTIKESGSVVVTEPYDAVRTSVNNGDIYVAGGTKLYKRTPGSNGGAGTYSEITISGVTSIRDLDYRQDLNTLYAFDEQVVHTYAPLSGTPTWAAASYGPYESANSQSGSNTYALPTSISEAAANALSITITKEPVYSFQPYVKAKGTGNWTVTMHDALNNVVAAQTINNASLPASGYVEFIFAAPVRASLGATYHFHITSSNGTGTVEVLTVNDLRAATHIIKATRLVNTGEFGHYTMQFGNKTLVGNERYLCEIEYNATFDPHRLVFPPDAIVTGATTYNQYVAVTCARRTSSDSLDAGINGGYIFLWDGASVFPELGIEVPFGVPWSPTSNDNNLRFIANGRIYQWAGGDFEPAYEFHGVDEFTAQSGAADVDVYLRAARHASTGRDSLSLFGFPHTTANPNVKIGVYSYGSTKMSMPKVAAFDYVPSHGHDSVQFNTATSPDTPITGITLLKNFGSNLLIGWKDYSGGAVTYGIDYVNDKNGYAAAGSYESLWIDDDVQGRPAPDKDKLGKSLKVRFFALPAGCTVRPKVQYDRSGVWTYIDTPASAGATSAILQIDAAKARYKEVMVGYDITSSNGNNVRIKSCVFKYDDLTDEETDTEIE